MIVVSKPAARLGLERLARHWPQPPGQVRWFSVGAATGEVLTAAGLDAHWPESGDDSEALAGAAGIHRGVAAPHARVLIMRGEGGREFLAERLRGQGVTVDYLELYRRRLPDYPPRSLQRLIRAERLNGLVVSSGQGFEHLNALAGDDWPTLARLPLFVPSPRVAELARDAGAQVVVDCRGASASALLAALENQPAPAPDAKDGYVSEADLAKTEQQPRPPSPSFLPPPSRLPGAVAWPSWHCWWAPPASPSPVGACGRYAASKPATSSS